MVVILEHETSTDSSVVCLVVLCFPPLLVQEKSFSEGENRQRTRAMGRSNRTSSEDRLVGSAVKELNIGNSEGINLMRV